MYSCNDTTLYYAKYSIASLGQSEFFKIARPTPIRSATPCDNNSSACCGVVIPPVKITGMETTCFMGREVSEKYPACVEYGFLKRHMPPEISKISTPAFSSSCAAII